MFWAFIGELALLGLWVLGTVIVARMNEIAGKHAEMRDLRVQHETYGLDRQRSLRFERVVLRDSRYVTAGYRQAWFVASVGLILIAGGSLWSPLFWGFTPLIFVSFLWTAFCIVWFVEYQLADDERDRLRKAEYFTANTNV